MNTVTFLVLMSGLIVATFFMGRWSKQAEYEDEFNDGLRALGRVHEGARKWKVQGEPASRPGFKYSPRFFDSQEEAELFAGRLRRDGCYVPQPTQVDAAEALVHEPQDRV